MDGLLIVDKPSGPTSHDIVARVRRVLRERRIGHTGTLDPMASGVLPLVIGRATRLARFLGNDKTYDAAIRLGVQTDTYDALGEPVDVPYGGPWPARETVDAALDRFRGTFLQQPPAFSAKKIAGRRSYDIARRGAQAAAATAEPAVGVTEQPAPVAVTAYAIELLDVDGSLVRLRVHSSAGFYIRSLAHDLGTALGTGAHLAALCRIAAAGAVLKDAVALQAIEAEDGTERALAALVPMDRMLPDVPAVALTDTGVEHVRAGRNIGPADTTGGYDDAVRTAYGTAPGVVRLLAPSGQLVAIAGPSTPPGLLHPAVVLI